MTFFENTSIIKLTYQKEAFVMFYRLRMLLQRFMMGRYGIDGLFYFFFALYFILSMVNAFANSLIIYLLSLVLLFVMFFRVFSRNIYKRQRENVKFLSIYNKVKRKLKIRKYDPYHVFRKCPKCKTTLRLPRRNGKHTVCCPKCKTDFKVRIL